MPDLTPAAPKPLAVTISVALSITGIGRTKLYQLVNDGTIESIKIGRRRLINYASLEQLASNPKLFSSNQNPSR